MAGTFSRLIPEKKSHLIMQSIKLERRNSMGMKIMALIFAIMGLAVSAKGGYEASVELVDAVKAFKEKPEGENTEKKTEESE